MAAKKKAKKKSSKKKPKRRVTKGMASNRSRRAGVRGHASGLEG